jgi:hypothetical protein
MNWAAPLWLWALLPWTAAVLYLLWGCRPRVDVPFLDLWPAPGDEAVRVRRRATPPPIALALAILGTLLALLAAGRPGIRASGAGLKVSLVVDRGYTMSARGPAGQTRLTELFQRVPLPPNAQITRHIVPPADEKPTAVDTRELLDSVVRNALNRDESVAVIVLTDQPLAVADDRLIQIAPENPVRNARILFTSARETPAPQVMVRVRSSETIDRVKLRVTSGEQSAEHEVSFASGEHDEFIDLPQFGQTIKAELVVDDDQPADDTAWLVREASWPRIEPRVPLPPALQRMVEVYRRGRPPSDLSRSLVIVSEPGDLSADRIGVVVPNEIATQAAAQGMQLKDHPVTTNLTWLDVGTPGLAKQSSPADWTPIVTAEGKTWVAVREAPVRAVWVGFDTSAWATSPEFVVFWANVFNWVGEGVERFASYPVGTHLEGQWTPVELAESVTSPEPLRWPGLQRRSDGMLRALHAPDVPFPMPVASNWRERMEKLRGDPSGHVEFAPWLSSLAVVCMAGAAATWKRREAGVQRV